MQTPVAPQVPTIPGGALVQSALVQQAVAAMHAVPHILKPVEHG